MEEAHLITQMQVKITGRALFLKTYRWKLPLGENPSLGISGFELFLR
jgi:hypothetical protein